MSKQRLAAVEALFQAAVELPPESRENFLAEHCRHDFELRDLLTRLLAQDDIGLGSFLESPIIPPNSTSGDGLVPEQGPAFAPGEWLAGRYRVERLLGKGGMSEVYEVWDDELSIPVALKTLRIDVTQDTGRAIRRLKQEAMLARAIVHPNTCRVYDVGSHDVEERPIWFLTMEVLRGETLQEKIRARGRLTPAETLPLVRQMSAGLEAAHQAGIVHGDFKSGNVMLVDGPNGEEAVVTDFGLAREIRSRGPAKSESQESIKAGGTPAYMAPEQVRGDEPRPAADIYALGVVIYEMVTGRLPFTGRTPWEAARRRLHQPPISPRELVSALDADWEHVILRCLALEPQRRFFQAGDVAKALAGFDVEASDDVASGAPSRRRLSHTLPVEIDAFVRREADLEDLHGKLGRTRLVTLTGAAGMGKSRIAIYYGRKQLADWPGGVWFCDLAEARSLADIVSAVAASLEIQLGRGNAVTQLAHAIAGRKRCLMILDNFEQVIDLAEETVGVWLALTKAASFLVTSRERLSLPKEAVQVLGPLPLDAGLSLLIERSRRLCPGLTFEGEDLASAKEVVRLAEGLPLAIELAASRMRVMSVAKIGEGMQKRFRLLTGGASSRHETLAAAIDGSWELLQPWEMAAWTQCTVFEGGFTLEAAENVVDLSTWPGAPWLVDILQSLVDKSLLQLRLSESSPSTAMPETRFGFLVSLQEYARAKLDVAGTVPEEMSGAGPRRAAEERHGKWYARLGSEEAIEELHRQETMQQALHPELDNLVTACRRAIARNDEKTAGATYRAAGEIYDRRGPFGSAVQLGHEVLTAIIEPGLRARALLTLGTAEGRSGLRDESRVHLVDALANFRELGDRRGESFVLGNLGSLNYVTSNFEEALTYYQAAIVMHRELGNRRLEGMFLANVGRVHSMQGRPDQARNLLEAASAIHCEVGNWRSQAAALSSLANIHHQQGRMEDARRCYEEALRIDRELSDRPSEAATLCDLGTVLHTIGLLSEAETCFNDSLAIQREVGQRPSEGVVLGVLGRLHFDQGRMEEAECLLEAALAIHREVGDKRSEGINLGNLGNVHLENGRTQDALEYQQEALAILRQVGHRRFEAIVLGYLSKVFVTQGRVEEAQETLAKAEVILRELGDKDQLAKTLCIRALIESNTGDRNKASATLIEVEALAERAGVKPESELHRCLKRVRQAIQASI